MKKPGGQIVIGAIIVLVILAILVPAIIIYVQNESKWSVKEQRTTRAFEIAEAGVERGFQQIILSTSVWASIQAGGTLSGLNFDQVYTDIPGGRYEIKVSKVAGTQEASIVGVGQDSSTKELRAIKAIYGNTVTNSAVYAIGAVVMNSNPTVEWGPVMSPNTITTSHLHPRYYSAGDIIGRDPNGPTPPNTDNIQWWSYDTNLPPAPQVDIQSYFNDATGAGTVFPGGTYSGLIANGTYYFTGDTTLKPPGNFITGALIVMGSLTIQGNASAGNYVATIPSNAWKEYGDDWGTWQATYDPGAGAWPGINGTYSTSSALPLTSVLDKVVCHGFMYVANNFSITGGGNCAVHGSMYIGGNSTWSGSPVALYFDDKTSYKTKNVSLVRVSWQDWTGCSWTSANPTCP